MLELLLRKAIPLPIATGDTSCVKVFSMQYPTASGAQGGGGAVRGQGGGLFLGRRGGGFLGQGGAFLGRAGGVFPGQGGMFLSSIASRMVSASSSRLAEGLAPR